MSLSLTAAGLRDEIVRDVTVPKILVVPARSQGRQMLERICLQGEHWVNVRIETLDSLAFRIAAGRMAAEKRRWADSLDCRLIVEEILAERTADPGSYFRDLSPGPGMTATLLNAINDLRMADLDPDGVLPQEFESKAKGIEVRACLELYIDKLAARNLCDRADAFRLAVAMPPGDVRGVDDIFIVAPGLELYGLTRRFFDLYLAGRARFLSADAVTGAACPPHLAYRQTGEPATALGCAFAPEEWSGKGSGPEAADIDLFHAAGISSELREVLRRITAEGLGLDEVEIVAADTAVYGAAFLDLCARLGFPCTLADGLPAARTRPGRAADALLDWFETGFAAEPIRRLLLSGDVRLASIEGVTPEGNLAAQIFRNLGIGWGRERYLKIVDSRIRAAREAPAKLAPAELAPAEDAEDGPGAEAARLRRAALHALRALFVDLLEGAPDCGPGKDVSPALLAGRVRRFLQDRLDVERDAGGNSGEAGFDRQALERLDKRLDKLAGGGFPKLPVKEAGRRVRACLDDLRVGRSGPRPGHIHLSAFKHGGRSGRRRIFVVGMDETRFPGSGGQNPLLLDGERSGLSPDLVSAEDALRANALAMGAMLAGLRGRVTLSFCGWDLTDNRSVAPSPLVLQVFRIIAGDPSADYAALKVHLGQPAGPVPETDRELDETDAWLGAMNRNGMMRDAGGLLAVRFPGLARGLEAAAARESDEPTRFDGLVNGDDARDPRRNRGVSVSCSRIELLGNCPLAYFFRRVLGIEKPDDREYDPARWLDAMQRGNLLHDVYREYIQELIDSGERPSARTEERLVRILENRLEMTEREIPPPSRLVRDFEVRDLVRSVRLFNRMEMEDTTGTPLLLEYGFGVRKAGLGAGSTEEPYAAIGPISIELPSGKAFHFSGRIDRVDRIGENDYCVLDYKTGRSGSYDGRWYFMRGRRVQHALYAIAAEAVIAKLGLSAHPAVREAGYVFPTSRGEGLRVTRPQDRRKELLELLDRLFDVMRDGLFLAADDGAFCPICDYHDDVCGDAAAIRAKAKLKKGSETVLETIAAIKNYE